MKIGVLLYKCNIFYREARIYHFKLLSFAASKELVIKKYPQYKDEIEFFVQRDPTKGTLKYLDWEIKMLLAKQALCQEIANVIDLFHKYSSQLNQKDINQYHPNNFLDLRSELYNIKSKSELKKERKNKIYPPIDPEKIACGHKIIYDSDNFKCVQIINREAAAHYGIETRWCITSQETAGFDEFDKNNVIIFYLINKHLTKADPNYKLAFTYTRDFNNKITERRIINSRDIGLFGMFESSDQHASGSDKDIFMDKNLNMELSKIQEKMMEIAKSYPKSMMAKFFSGELPIPKMFEMFNSEKNEHSKNMLALYLIRHGGDGDPDLEQWLDN